MLVRAATPDDASALAIAWHAMLEESGLLLPVVDPNWARIVAAQIRSAIADRSQVWWVAEANGEIVATAAAIFIETAAALALTGRSATIAGIYTAPAFRRQGYARTLTERAIDVCRERGCRIVRLRASKLGRPLYESLGFVDGEEMVLRLTDS